MNFKSILFENWGIKLVSLVLSLTLWFFVTSKGKAEMMLTVPIELRNIPQGMAVVGDVTGYLEARVQGQERVLRDITIGKKVVGVIDLSMTRVGENIVRISADDIKRPAGVVVTHMSLSEIRVKLEPLVRRSYRLRPVLYGVPAPGYRFAGTTVTPQRIVAEGPDSVMAALERLQTMPIDIQGSSASLTVEPKIDYRGQPVKLLEKNISVRVIIERIAK